MAFKDPADEKAHMANELQRFKDEINMFELAQERYNFKVDYEKCGPHNVKNADTIVMTNGTDRTLMSCNPNWVYWDRSGALGRNNKTGGDIISFVQWQEGGKSLGHVRKVLRGYLTGNPVPRTRTYTTQPQKSAPPAHKNLTKITKTLQSCRPLVQSDYLESRGITSETLNHPLFHNRVLKGYNNMIIFPHWNQEGQCGYEMKNANFKGFPKEGYKGLWYTQIPKQLDNLIFVESSIEALSHFQKFQPTNSAYFTASGTWSSKIGELIGKVINKYPQARVITAFNNDAGGQQQTKNLAAIAKTQGRQITPTFPKTAGSDWNDSLAEPEPARHIEQTKTHSLRRTR